MDCEEDDPQEAFHNKIKIMYAHFQDVSDSGSSLGYTGQTPGKDYTLVDDFDQKAVSNPSDSGARDSILALCRLNLRHRKSQVMFFEVQNKFVVRRIPERTDFEL